MKKQQITDATCSSLTIKNIEDERETVIGPTQRMVVVLEFVHLFGEEKAKELLDPKAERAYMPDAEKEARSLGNGIFIEFLKAAVRAGSSFPSQEADVRAFMNDMYEARRLAFRDGVSNLTIEDANETMKYLILFGDKHWAVTTLHEILEHGTFLK